MQEVDVVAADGSKAIAMFKLLGGAVVAHGSQQPDRKKTAPEPGIENVKKHAHALGGRGVSIPGKTH